ncbi:MAG TPA: choice-of-anchor Q domain-containing protein [Xanthomonadaceae bacterium]|nr:choice-of-anchor Q domain-containing protein [Xanthomonadaceae bacterium]
MTMVRLISSLLAAASLIASGTTVAGDAPVNLIVVDMPQDTLEPDNKCSLREAIINASTNSRIIDADGECPAGSALMTDVIVLESGVVYELLPAGAGQHEVFHNAALELDLRIETDGEAPATLHQIANGRRIMQISGATVELDNLVFTGGNGVDLGGAIANFGGSVKLSRVSLINNAATIFGGAIYTIDGSVELVDSRMELNNAAIGGGALMVNDGGSARLANTVVRANSASYAGGIYSLGSLEVLAGSVFSLNTATGIGGGGAIINWDQGELLVEDAVFDSNSAPLGNGGAILSNTLTPGSVLRSDFSNNQAVNGGAIESPANSFMFVVDNRFIGNQAQQDGGAIRARAMSISSEVFLNQRSELIGNQASGDGGAIDAQFLILARSRLFDNEAEGRGGGIFLRRDAFITGVQIEANHAGSHGGGLYYDPGVDSGDLVMHRSLILGNHADGLTGQGGGLWLGRETVLGNTTLHANAAASGGGLFIHPDADVTAVNITLAGHIAGQDLHQFGVLKLGNSIISTPGQPNCAQIQPIVSLGHNLSNDLSCTGLDHPADMTGVDPKLLELASAENNTRVLPLAPDSPAIDAGDDEACAAAPVFGNDKRMAARPAGDACDIGAYESGAVALFTSIFSDGFENP